MLPELIVFDLAGTTVRDEGAVPRILKEAMAAFGVEVSLEDTARLMGIPKPEAISQLMSKNGGITNDKTLAQIHELFVKNMISYYVNDPHVAELAGVSDLFRDLKKRGVKIVVDTGFDRATTDPLLDRMRWIGNGLIDGSVTSDEVPRGRPAPDMIFKAMVMTDVMDVAKVAKVGDTQSDLIEGTQAGCKWVIGVSSGAYSREHLMLEPHTHILNSVVDLRLIFDLAGV